MNMLVVKYEKEAERIEVFLASDPKQIIDDPGQWAYVEISQKALAFIKDAPNDAIQDSVIFGDEVAESDDPFLKVLDFPKLSGEEVRKIKEWASKNRDAQGCGCIFERSKDGVVVCHKPEDAPKEWESAALQNDCPTRAYRNLSALAEDAYHYGPHPRKVLHKAVDAIGFPPGWD